MSANFEWTSCPILTRGSFQMPAGRLELATPASWELLLEKDDE